MERFLIAGCQRTGTTLVRLLLESHSKIECIDEALSYEVLAGRQIQPHQTTEFVGYKIPIWTDQLMERTLDRNELPFAFEVREQIPNFYTGEKIVFMIRHPLDAIASMIQLKIENDSWLQRVGVPVLKRKNSDPEFRKTFGTDLDVVNTSSDPSVACAALYWKFKSSALIKYRANNMPVHAVVYEQLVKNPEQVLRNLLSFLGAEWEHALLSHHLLPHRQLVDGKAIGNTNPFRPIDDGSVGQWQTLLTTSQVEIIRKITDPLEQSLYPFGLRAWAGTNRVGASG